MLFQDKIYDEERALYGLDGAQVVRCRFDGPADGESALKECRNLEVDGCFFNLRYPFWHVNHAVIRNSEMTELCRAALWYDQDIRVEHSTMHGIKAFRECEKLEIVHTDVVSPEFLWRCKDITIQDSRMESEYLMFECKNVQIRNLQMKGKYSFQYVENMEIRDSDLNTKDAFWHTKNVTVYDSVLRGEYLGWYSENLKLVRCKIIGTQPLCYCKGLVLEDCTMENTDLCFERSEVLATVCGRIDSIKNPASGKIVAGEIGEQILEPEFMDMEKVEICCG